MQGDDLGLVGIDRAALSFRATGQSNERSKIVVTEQAGASYDV